MEYITYILTNCVQIFILYSRVNLAVTARISNKASYWTTKSQEAWSHGYEPITEGDITWHLKPRLYEAALPTPLAKAGHNQNIARYIIGI